ncbi:MAG: SulP family inorganic anion transporter [Alphaproteobacteria bacterium]
MAMNPARILPIIGWLAAYRRADLPGDLMAGVITAIMIVPQAMAYALLAGMPPQAGLYASIAPLLAYACFGTSRTLAVGPVAIISLLTAASLAPVAASGSDAYQAAALVLALEVGAISIGLAVIRAGHLVNFISHPVISGFTSAAAIVIGFSNMKDILGISVPRADSIVDLLASLGAGIGGTNWVTLAIGAGGIGFLLLLRGPLTRRAKRLGRWRMAAVTLLRAGPLLLVALSTLAVFALDLDTAAGVAVVGAIPTGLPPLTIPGFDEELWLALLPSAAMIALIGFLESVAVAKALAAKRRQKIEANNELAGLGAANIAAAFTGGFPVTGGFGRSNVNFDAGAATQLSAVVTAGLVALTVILLPPLFRPLPPAALAAIIVVSVLQLIDIAAFRRAWRYNRADAAALLVTFAGVLLVNVETGILIGIAASLGLLMWRTAKPHYAVVGRVGATEHFRNVKRHAVRTDPRILAIRIDESLFFANARFLETTILAEVAERPKLAHVVLICSAVNAIDSSALESLETLIDELRDAGVTFHLAEVKGPVMDRLQRTDLLERMAPGQVFLSTHDAMTALEEPRPIAVAG